MEGTDDRVEHQGEFPRVEDVVWVIGPIEGDGGVGPIQVFNFGGRCGVDRSACELLGSPCIGSPEDQVHSLR